MKNTYRKFINLVKTYIFNKKKKLEVWMIVSLFVVVTKKKSKKLCIGNHE